MGMAAMKITLSGAMRARDVSRPQPEHLAAAAAREDAVSPSATQDPSGHEDAPAAEQEPRSRRRRRRTR
jgi:hypothetical protein